jgi:RimJ/RimL family protein N-acetyltransferase
VDPLSIKPVFREAKEEDIFQIAKLYDSTYQGSYPDPLMRDFYLIQQYLQSPHNFWFVCEIDHHIVGSLLFRYDDINVMAKSFGAVMDSKYRGQHFMEGLLQWGIHYIRTHTPGLEIIYSTTRTLHEAAQSLTERCGFKKLGIFPNARKTQDYETHALAAIITPEALEKRHGSYYVHHHLKPFYDLVSAELSLPESPVIQPDQPTRTLFPCDHLEFIEAEFFIKYRYEELKKQKKLVFEFFPFHEPNCLLINPDQRIEVFCHLSRVDGHCTYIGAHLPHQLDYQDLFIRTNRLLRNQGARYLEILVRADRPKVLERVLMAKFIPCAFFPAFQQIGNTRYDFFVFSKSYEIFDFQLIRLKGLNQRFLEEYFKAWKRVSLTPKLLEFSEE